MNASGVRVGVSVLNEYMRAALRLQKYDLTLRLLQTVLQTHTPNEQTHRFLLELPTNQTALAEAGLPTEVKAQVASFYYHCIKLLQRGGHKIRITLYVTFLHSCVRADRLDLARQIIEMRRSNTLQIYQLFKKYIELVEQWEDRVDRLAAGARSRDQVKTLL
jgi:hypothetical protein